MPNAKRIFLIGNFKDESPQSVRIERRRWVKGLIRLGHDVQRFSYRNIMQQASLIKNKRFAQQFAKKRTDKILIKQVKSYHPDIVFVLNMKYLDENTVLAMRGASLPTSNVHTKSTKNGSQISFLLEKRKTKGLIVILVGMSCYRNSLKSPTSNFTAASETQRPTE